MKISIVTGFFLPVPALAGGAMEKIWYKLGQLMAESGHEVTLVSRRWRGLPDTGTEGRLRHVRLPGFNHTRHLPFNLALDFIWGLRVARALPPGDFVVCNTVALPAFLHRFKPAAGRIAVSLARMPKGQNRLYGDVSLLLASSRAVADQTVRENPRLAERTILFPNPIDWKLHRDASAQGTTPDPLTIGYMGRIHPEKGLENLLAAAALLASRADLPPWRLVLTGAVSVPQGGGGEAYRDSLLATYTPALGERLRFEPPVYDAVELARRYGRTDVFCYPSLAAKGEGLSVAPLEAMAAGAAPVVSELDCYRDILQPGINGFQFNQGSSMAANELAAILARLLGDAALRRTIAAQAQASTRAYDFPVAAERLIEEFGRRNHG